MIKTDEFKIILLKEINSLKNKGGDFERLIALLDNPHIKYPSSPGTPKELINDVKEKAFQRAIFHARFSVIKSSRCEIIEWADFELPVIQGRESRRPSIDLLGILDEIPVILELKYGSSNDSPFLGVCELLVYTYLIGQNYRDLGSGNGVRHKSCRRSFKWEDIIKNRPRLFFAADSSYWKRWKINSVHELSTLVTNLNEKLDVSLSLIETAHIDFVKQKTAAGQKPYKPFLNSITWKELFYENMNN